MSAYGRKQTFNSIEAMLGHIRHFGTHPDWTNRGIGRAIYRLCEADARSAGITSFECYSTFNAESFYSVLGFESIRSIDVEGGALSKPGVLGSRYSCRSLPDRRADDR